MERRLAAILAADVVGYSRLIREDEAGTLTALKAHREQLIEPKVAERKGRIVKLMGDGLLVEFPSAVEAVQCAVEIQHLVGEHNADIPAEKRIVYRIGINIGDIVVEDNDIYGDGVNVAARLEGLAEPSGICVARNVFDQVKDKLDLTIEHLGERDIKNIAEPVTVYRVVLDAKAVALVTPVVQEATKPVNRRWVVAATAAAVLVAAVGGVFWWQPWAPDVEPASVERMAFPLPDKPSLAVLPFTNMSDDPKQEYFVDGMTDDLITGLSKLSGLFVISRNSTFTYKGKPVKVRQVAEDLGVRYVLEGSVRRSGDRVRVNAQLVDAVSGFHLWAEKYDGPLTDIFALQDKVVGQIVTALAVNLTSAESAQKGQAETAVPQAYDALLQGWDHYRRQTPEDYGKAISFFEKAIELDPDYSRAYAGLAAVYWNVYDNGWGVHLGIEYQTIDRAKQNLARALEQPTSDAYAVSADMLVGQGRNDEALAEINRAIALAPNDAGNYRGRAWVLTALGRAEEAENDARLAIRLDPSYHSNLLALGRALFYQKRYEEAAEALERAVSRLPDYEFAYHNLAATYGHLGRIEDAHAAIEKYNEIVAKTSGSPLTLQAVETFWGGGWYDFDKTYLRQFVEGLRKAGVPEGATVETVAVDYRDLVSKSAGTFDVEGAVKIDATGAKALFDRGVVIIDARGSGPYSRGHIPNAINFHTNTKLTEEALSERVGLNEEVVFYCGGEDCPLSANACAKALIWGYTKVFYFAGGYPAWKKAGYPVATP